MIFLLLEMWAKMWSVNIFIGLLLKRVVDNNKAVDDKAVNNHIFQFPLNKQSLRVIDMCIVYRVEKWQQRIWTKNLLLRMSLIICEVFKRAGHASLSSRKEKHHI